MQQISTAFLGRTRRRNPPTRLTFLSASHGNTQLENFRALRPGVSFDLYDWRTFGKIIHCAGLKARMFRQFMASMPGRIKHSRTAVGRGRNRCIMPHWTAGHRSCVCLPTWLFTFRTQGLIPLRKGDRKAFPWHDL